MPILGLSETRRMPRRGKIHLGIKKASQRKGVLYPDATDYFVVKADQTTSPEAAEDFKDFYGPTPKNLSIMFPVDQDEIIFPQYFKQYKSSQGLVCKGDGKSAMRNFVENNVVQRKTIECPAPETCQYVKKNASGKGDCGKLAHLQFFLPDIKGMGVWQIDTSSVNSIIDINSQIAFIREVAGRISMIPLNLTLRPKEVNPDGRKKVVYTLYLEYKGSLQDLAKLQTVKMPTSDIEMPEVDHDEVPEDHRPDALVPSSGIKPWESNQAKDEPRAEEDPAEETDPPNEPPDALAGAIQAEIFRLGFTPAQVEYLKKSFADKNKLLSQLQKTQIKPERLRWLKAKGYKVDEQGRRLS